MIPILLLQLTISQDFIPPGTIKVGDMLVDKTEVLIIHWWEYEHLENKDTIINFNWAKDKKVRVLDSTGQFIGQPNSSMTWYKNRNSRFLPMTMITYDQAVAFCQWRSEIVSEKFGVNVVYRLPTPEEWRQIAEHKFNRDKKKILRQLNNLNKAIVEAGDEFLLDERLAPPQNVVDLFWNVSEMTSEKGVAMGPNNSNVIMRTDLFKPYLYEGFNRYLGFRCVAEIQKR